MIQKLVKILDILLIVAMLLIIPVEITYLFYHRTQLTSKSFEEISYLNNEIKKIASIQGEKFSDEERLIFSVNKLIDPNIFSKHYFLKNYLIDFTYDGGYYYVKNNSELTINNEVLDNLKLIKDVPYRTYHEFDQSLRETIGLENFKKYSSFISSVKDNKTSWQRIGLYFYIGIFILLIIARLVVSFILGDHKKKVIDKELNDNIDKAKRDITEKPEKIAPVWDLANYTLQKYYNKNLSQIDSIYKLSIAVMIMGFALIVSILIATTYYKIDVKLESIGIIAGIITEFIGATFLFIYKSTITQALQHSKSLEDINNVGMSIKIIESISKVETNKEKLDDAKIEIAKKLITTHSKA